MKLSSKYLMDPIKKNPCHFGILHYAPPRLLLSVHSDQGSSFWGHMAILQVVMCLTSSRCILEVLIHYGPPNFSGLPKQLVIQNRGYLGASESLGEGWAIKFFLVQAIRKFPSPKKAMPQLLRHGSRGSHDVILVAHYLPGCFCWLHHEV